MIRKDFKVIKQEKSSLSKSIGLYEMSIHRTDKAYSIFKRPLFHLIAGKEAVE